MISRYTPLSTVFLALLILTACDPEWDGRWKVTKADGEPLGSGPGVYYDLSEETIVQIVGPGDSGDCSIYTLNVSEIDSSVVTTDGAELNGEDINESAPKARFEVSGETLKITFLDNQKEQTAKRIDGNPRYLAGCER